MGVEVGLGSFPAGWDNRVFESCPYVWQCQDCHIPVIEPEEALPYTRTQHKVLGTPFLIRFKPMRILSAEHGGCS